MAWRPGAARFSKNVSEEVRLTLQDFGFGRYVDFRIWSTIRAGDSMPSGPTERGLVLDVDLLPDLKRAIDQATVVLGANTPVGQMSRRLRAEGHGDERTQDPEGAGRVLNGGETGTSQPEGEKRRAEKPAEARTLEGEEQGQGPDPRD